MKLTLLARNQYWNLAASPFPDFVHDFHILRNGRQLHYIRNKVKQPQPGNLVILIHGFPDSYMMWKGLLQDPSVPLRAATWICLDLPGFGGSDSFDKYDTTVLEALTEFVVEMRSIFLCTDASGDAQKNAYIVGHDWGAALALRLAAEAPVLADRFIVTNGPHVSIDYQGLGCSNIYRLSLPSLIPIGSCKVRRRSSSSSSRLRGRT